MPRLLVHTLDLTLRDKVRGAFPHFDYDHSNIAFFDVTADVGLNNVIEWLQINHPEATTELI